MKTNPILAALLALALIITGCANYKAAGVVAVTADKAMTSWGHYFDNAIEDPAAFNTTAPKLWSQRAQVDKGWEAYRSAMNTVDDTRQAGGDVTAALKVAQARSSEYIAIVLSFLPAQYQPK